MSERWASPARSADPAQGQMGRKGPLLRGESKCGHFCINASLNLRYRIQVVLDTRPNDRWAAFVGEGADARKGQCEGGNSPARPLHPLGYFLQAGAVDVAQELQRQVQSVQGDPTDGSGSRGRQM